MPSEKKDLMRRDTMMCVCLEDVMSCLHGFTCIISQSCLNDILSTQSNRIKKLGQRMEGGIIIIEPKHQTSKNSQLNIYCVLNRHNDIDCLIPTFGHETYILRRLGTNTYGPRMDPFGHG